MKSLGAQNVPEVLISLFAYGMEGYTIQKFSRSLGHLKS